ncbi:MAG: fumarylacetoacetate hydrolase family protein, partial [Bdellovibrionota bacterium]
RDLQEVAKKKSLPWAVAKGFDTFAPVGPFIPASDIPDPAKIEFELKVNGELRQKGHTGQMLFSIERLIDHLSGIFTLAEGDLIFTGTPPGVGPLVAGDRLEARILGTAARLSVSVQAARGRGRR